MIKVEKYTRRVEAWPIPSEGMIVFNIVRYDISWAGYTETAYCISEADANKILDAQPRPNMTRLEEVLEAGTEFNEALKVAGYVEG